MKKNQLLFLFLLFTITLHAQQNITFRSNLPYPGKTLANIWGYAAGGNEYALVGTTAGLSIVDVTNPVNPVEKIAVPGISSSWREIKTFQHYAYVTTEGGGGLQIVNLQYLPDSVQVKLYTGDGAIAGQLSNIHALHIDDGYVYLYGGSLFGGAAKICDLNPDPWNPVYKGHTPGPYIHDGYVRNDTLWAGHIGSGYFGVYNVANKANPVLIASQNTPGNAPHNTWLSSSGRTLYTTDEVSNSYLTAYDVSDITNIFEKDRIQVHPGDNSSIHNTYVINNYAVSSWYTAGVSIVDASYPGHLVQTGFYDTSPNSGAGFSGCWGVYPYLPSGNILASDMQQGLYVLTPTYKRACHLTGIVKDSLTNFPLNNVLVEIVGNPEFDNTKITGSYSTGLATAGTYSIRFSKTGYVTKIKTGITLNNGTFVTLNPLLAPVSVKLNPVADAYVRSGSFAGTNYGSATRLLAKKADNLTNAGREIYLRFNITSIDSNVSIAKLRLFGALNTTATPTVNVDVYDVSSQSWQESVINYTNKPPASPVISFSQAITGTTLKYYEWDITALVQQKKTAGETSVSLALRCSANTASGNYVTFYSKEAASSKPQLYAVSSTSRVAEEAPTVAQEKTGPGVDLVSIDYHGNPPGKFFTASLYPLQRKSSVIPQQPVILKQFHSPTSSPDDITFDGKHLWVEGYSALQLFQVDTSNGTVIRTIPTSIIRPYGLAFGLDHLWVADTDNKLIFELDTVTGAVLNSFNTPANLVIGSYPGGLVFDGTNLWNNDPRAAGGSSPYDSIFEISTAGTFIDGFSNPQLYATGLAFDGNYFWSSDNLSQVIDKIDPLTHAIVASIYAPGGQYPNGLEWDGQHLWVINNYSDSIYKLDVSMITGVHTIPASPNSITVSPNPFSEKTELYIPVSSLDDKCYLEIYDITGNIVKRVHIENSRTEITRENFSNGLYFYRIVNSHGIPGQGKMVIE